MIHTNIKLYNSTYHFNLNTIYIHNRNLKEFNIL